MKTMILAFFDIFTYSQHIFLNLNISTHSFLHLFGKRKHCAKFRFSVGNERLIIKPGFLKKRRGVL